MRIPSDKDTRIAGRLRTSVMGLLEVRLFERARRRSEKSGNDETLSLLDRLGEKWGSRIIPIEEPVAADGRIIPGHDLRSMIDRALISSFDECYCRKTHQNCDHPQQTCIGLTFGESYGAVTRRPPGKTVKRQRAIELVEECHERGLIQQTVFYPSPEYFYVICNCCTCCCIPLNRMQRFGKSYSVAASDYVVSWKKEQCSECLACLDRCHFGAVKLNGGTLSVDADACYGCGLCISTCLRNALELKLRKKPGQNMQV